MVVEGGGWRECRAIEERRTVVLLGLVLVPVLRLLLVKVLVLVLVLFARQR